MPLRPHVSLDRTTGLLLTGDLLCIGLFATLGALQHPEGTPLYLRIPEIAAPFVAGWLLVGAVTGIFAGEPRGDVGPIAIKTAGTWLGADIIGQALRATSVVPGGTAPAFVIVSLLVGGGLLIGWRVVAVRTVGRPSVEATEV